MGKKLIIIISLFTIVFLTITVYQVKRNDKTSYEKTNINNIAIFEETEIENIKAKNDTLEPTDISYTIGEMPVTKIDIQIEENKLNSFSEEGKRILCKNQDVIVEITKQFVAEQEAIKNGLSISDSKKKRYKEIAETFYRDSGKTIPKQQFIEIWIATQERDELADLFMADTLTKITTNEFSCDNDLVKKAVKDYKKDKTPEKLNIAYNEYLMFLISTYNIKY